MHETDTDGWIGIAGACPPPSIHLRLCAALRGPPSSPRLAPKLPHCMQHSTGRPAAASTCCARGGKRPASRARTHARTHASRLRSGRDGRIGWGGMRSGSRNPHPEFKTPRRAAVQCSDVTARPRAAPEEAPEQASSRARRSTVARATWAAAVCAATCSVGGRINDASGKVGEVSGAEQSSIQRVTSSQPDTLANPGR